MKTKLLNSVETSITTVIASDVEFEHYGTHIANVTTIVNYDVNTDSSNYESEIINEQELPMLTNSDTKAIIEIAENFIKTN